MALRHFAYTSPNFTGGGEKRPKFCLDFRNITFYSKANIYRHLSS